jgi:hypothetical protein
MNKYKVRIFNQVSRKETMLHFMGNSIDSVIWHLMDVKHPSDVIKSVRLL